MSKTSTGPVRSRACRPSKTTATTDRAATASLCASKAVAAMSDFPQLQPLARNVATQGPPDRRHPGIRGGTRTPGPRPPQGDGAWSRGMVPLRRRRGDGPRGQGLGQTSSGHGQRGRQGLEIGRFSRLHGGRLVARAAVEHRAGSRPPPEALRTPVHVPGVPARSPVVAGPEGRKNVLGHAPQVTDGGSAVDDQGLAGDPLGEG